MSQLPPLSDSEATVRAFVAAAGLTPSDAEMAVLIAGYPELRARMDTMHRLAEARYESPSLVFDPDPMFADWDAAEAPIPPPPLVEG
jgi:hypothetical protein